MQDTASTVATVLRSLNCSPSAELPNPIKIRLSLSALVPIQGTAGTQVASRKSRIARSVPESRSPFQSGAKTTSHVERVSFGASRSAPPRKSCGLQATLSRPARKSTQAAAVSMYCRGRHDHTAATMTTVRATNRDNIRKWTWLVAYWLKLLDFRR